MRVFTHEKRRRGHNQKKKKKEMRQEEEEEEDMSFRSPIIRRRDMFPMKISPLTKHG
jgi:hypothetical protein